MFWLPETQVSGLGSAMEKWVKARQVEQDFSSFFAKFLVICIYDELSKRKMPKALLQIFY